MIKGIGIDLIEINRFTTVSSDFYHQVFTDGEIKETRDNTLAAAIKFIVKEAILKALGIGLFYGFFWKKIELKNGMVAVTEPLKNNLSGKICIHTGAGNNSKYACAVAVIEDKQED